MPLEQHHWPPFKPIKTRRILKISRSHRIQFFCARIKTVDFLRIQTYKLLSFTCIQNVPKCHSL